MTTTIAMRKAPLFSVLLILAAACFFLYLGLTTSNQKGESIKSNKVRRTKETKTKEIITSCSTADRRALARRSSHDGDGDGDSDSDDDDTTIEDQWKAMTECLVDQQTNNKLGHFFLHVSKSGGTSMRGTMDSETKCYTHPTNPGRHFNPSVQSESWYRSSRTKEAGLQLPSWAHLNVGQVQGLPCGFYEGYMHKQSRLAIESEEVVGFEHDYQTKMGGGGGCRKFIKSTIFREPVARILSHYKHVKGLAEEENGHKEGGSQEMMMIPGDNQTFNVDFMVDVFDVLSDNYYTRSYVGHGIFEWESPNMTLVQHPEAWSKIFPAANATLHNMDWIILMSSGQDSEAANRDLILQNGLGWGPTATFLHKNTRHSSFSLSDEQKLRDMNALDYKLWEEALELNRLDVLSLKRMEPYYADAVEATKEERSDHCCGLVCWTYDDDVES